MPPDYSSENIVHEIDTTVGKQMTNPFPALANNI